MNINVEDLYMWTEKYRPTRLDDIISQQHISTSLKCFMSQGMLPHMLFYGPPGTGKTSMIKCCVIELFGRINNPMVLYSNASIERGIDDVRTTILPFANHKSECILNAPYFDSSNAKARYKIIILDEMDNMTSDAQNILRKVIEDSVNTVFCLIGNNINKINVALQSRCTLFRFSPLQPIDMLQKLKHICQIENDNAANLNKLSYTDDDLLKIIRVCNGDMRQAINNIQNISTRVIGGVALNSSSSSSNHTSASEIYTLIGYASPQIITTIYNMITHRSQSIKSIYEDISTIILNNNLQVSNILNELCDRVVLDGAIELQTKQKIIDKLATIEYNDIDGINQRSSIRTLIAVFALNCGQSSSSLDN